MILTVDPALALSGASPEPVCLVAYCPFKASNFERTTIADIS